MNEEKHRVLAKLTRGTEENSSGQCVYSMSSRNCAIVISKGHCQKKQIRCFNVAYMHHYASMCNPYCRAHSFVVYGLSSAYDAMQGRPQKPVTKRPKEVANPQLFFSFGLGRAGRVAASHTLWANSSWSSYQLAGVCVVWLVVYSS